MKYLALVSALAAVGHVSAQSDSTASASTPPSPTPTACPAAGESNALGEGCNPNRDYPGKACALLGDCYILEGLGVIVPTSTSSSTPTPTACPAAGESNALGEGCNPNRDYPGKACALLGDCYILEGLGVIVPTSTSSPKPTPTVCPPAGKTNAAGDYGCNPNRAYPGKACALIGDCYILRGLGGIVPNVTSSVVPESSTITTVINGVTTTMPVAHTSAHGGFVTTVINGVTTSVPIAEPTRAPNGGIITTGSDGAVTTLPPGAQPTGGDVPTAGAAQLSIAGGLAAVAFAAALL